MGKQTGSCRRRPSANGGAWILGTGVKLFGVLAGTGSLFLPIHAEEIGKEVFELAEFEVETRSEQLTELTNPRLGPDIREIPRGVRLLPGEVLDQMATVDLADSIGLEASAQPGDNYLSPYRLRGFTATLATNGVSQGEYANNTFFNEAATVERVEILKGPASIQFGNVEPGGVLNKVTKKPLAKAAAEIGLGYGFGLDGQELWEGRVDVTGPLLAEYDVNGRLILLGRNRDSFRDFVDSEETLVAPSISFRPFAKTRVLVEAVWEEESSFLDRGQPTIGAVGEGSDLTEEGLLAIPGTVNLQSPGNKYENRNSSLRFHLTQGLPGDLLLEFRAYGEFFEEERDSTDFFARSTFASLLGPLPANTVGRFTTDQFSENDLVGIQTDVSGEFGFEGSTHRWRLGLDVRKEEEDRVGIVGLAPPINVFNPVYGGDPPAPIQIPDDRYREVESIGAFVQNRFSSPDGRWLLLGALRYEAFEATTRTPENSFAFEEEAVTPQFGIVYALSPSLDAYGSYVESFKAPDPAGGALSNGEAPEPETASQAEAGLRWTVSENLRATAAVFELIKEDVVVTTNEVPPQSIQIGEQRSRGVEISLQGQVTPEWRVLLSGSYLDTEVREGFFSNPASGANEDVSGNPLPNTPEWSAGLYTDYRFSSDSALAGWTAGGALQYRGSRAGDLNSTFSLDAYTRIDAHLQYERGNWRLRLSIRNLLDESYHVTANQPVSVLPGNPLFARLDIRYRF